MLSRDTFSQLFFLKYHNLVIISTQKIATTCIYVSNTHKDHVSVQLINSPYESRPSRNVRFLLHSIVLGHTYYVTSLQWMGF